MANPGDDRRTAFGPTLQATGPATLPGQPPRLDVAETPLTESAPGDRYELLEVLGEGGMGEVRLSRDRRLGREIAVKVIRSAELARASTRSRFEREARVQGQLEHPSIVPIYDMGLDAGGTPYFTMRRLRGLTLQEILHGLREGRADLAQAFSQRRLLGAFASVCQAVAFAHARGVVHRDLKPANVMLGGFGEVYLLDWGLAKVFGAGELQAAAGEAVEAETAPRVSDSDTAPATRAGEAMGTPGYMSPEQMRGENDRVDERTDVYALGAILFEILTLERLHQGKSIAELYASTLGGADARASRRAPGRDVPPELETVCVRATRLDPEARYRSVQELLEDVERYLEGDRDLARRRELAAEHARQALGAAATAHQGGPGAAAARQHALREAGAALTLDPGQADALGVLARLLLGAPGAIPAEAQRELDHAASGVERAAARTGLALYLGWLLFVPVLLLLGVRDWQPLGVGACLIVATLALAGLSLTTRWRRIAGFAAFCGGAALVGVGSTIMGPHILMPNLALTNVLAFILFGYRGFRVPAIVIGSLSLLVPWTLQVTGVTASSYRFANDGFFVLPQMTHLSEWGVHLLMLLANLALVIATSAFAGKIRDQVGRSESAMFLQAWNLRQLLPAEVARKAAAQTPLTLGSER